MGRKSNYIIPSSQSDYLRRKTERKHDFVYYGLNPKKLVDNNASNNPEYVLLKMERNSIIGRFLNMLEPKEERVIRYIYGFDGEPKTLVKIGEELGLSRTRISQIEYKALRKLRHNKQDILFLDR